MRSQTKFGPDRFIRFFWIKTNEHPNKHPNKQTNIQIDKQSI